MRFLLWLSVFILLACPSWAKPVLDSREVLLIISDKRGDLDGEWLELAVRSMRHELGISQDELPVVRMGLQDPDAKAEHFQRLAVTSEQAPVLCLVLWGSPEASGPQSVVDSIRIEKARREQGLGGPRSVFIEWLKRVGKDNLIALIKPPGEPEPPQPVAPDPALVAYQERRYEDAIVLARESANPSLEAMARQDFQAQAALALAEEREKLALSVYQKLAALYPKDEFFALKVQELSTKPADLIVGDWKMTSKTGWAKFTASVDGSLRGKGGVYLFPIAGKIKGHWEITGDKERTFQLHWTNGHLHNIKLHENGQSFEGRGIKEGDVSGQKLNL